ncbi:MAG: NADH-quinone oxidoreductase subunit L [Bryocella sp.]
MNWILPNLWLIPALPVLAAGIIALAKQRHRKLGASLAIGSMAIAFLLSLCAFLQVLAINHGDNVQETFNFNWFQLGNDWVHLGWLLSPLTVVMLLMVTFVGLLIFIFSVGYMDHDENFTRFFCFLALFAGAMLGVVIANSLLLLFMCWEVVGLTSYLLIGFWYANPVAAAAAKKAFLVTRIGDIALFLGMAWLYHQTGTLLFYNNGAGCMEQAALTTLLAHTTILGLTASTGIGILIFCGAAGKSGQFPLHVWLPDAMEGPTPVSALIHAATMVAAGVFLVARVYPLMSAQLANVLTPSIALQVITWIGAITALFGALIAVAQFDIKRILAYSTISQLGYMMMGLGVGGVPVGMFHLITHAFFKSLLFLGAGSVIHGCNGEQDIRHMGGLRKYMPVTFATYGIGMLALCGFPLFFSGFWSKDEILHSAFTWSISRTPFYFGAIGALLTAFYMTRQICYVFAASHRKKPPTHAFIHDKFDAAAADHHDGLPHESPSVMTVPLILLAACTLVLGLLGAPSWPWFQDFLEDKAVTFNLSAFAHGNIVPLMFSSSVLVFIGLGLGWILYGRKITHAEQADPLLEIQPHTFTVLNHAFYFDTLYANTIVRATNALAHLADALDRWLWNGIVQAISYAALGFAWTDSFLDTYAVNGGFDQSCNTITFSGRLLALLQRGRIQNYLRYVGFAFVFAVAVLLWRAKL